MHSNTQSASQPSLIWWSARGKRQSTPMPKPKVCGTPHGTTCKRRAFRKNTRDPAVQWNLGILPANQCVQAGGTAPAPGLE